MSDAANELFEKWRSQFRKGFLELCLLQLISHSGRSYGLEMMEHLKVAGIEVTEGTLYPLLMRMTRDGSIVATWDTPGVGHPRKYYSVTVAGAALLEAMLEEYDRSDRARGRLSGGGTHS
jgi:PadR family transcriptional regulator PadR